MTEQPQNLMTMLDVYIQGRVNLCVTGLQDQITRLEIQNNELRAKLEVVTNQPSSSPEQFDASMERWLEYGSADVILKAMQNSTEWEDAISSVYGTTEFDDAVKEAVGQMNLEIRVS